MIEIGIHRALSCDAITVKVTPERPQTSSMSKRSSRDRDHTRILCGTDQKSHRDVGAPVHYHSALSLDGSEHQKERQVYFVEQVFPANISEVCYLSYPSSILLETSLVACYIFKFGIDGIYRTTLTRCEDPKSERGASEKVSSIALLASP